MKSHTDGDRKKGVDRETVNRDVGVGRGKWVNKHTKKGGDGSASLRTSEIRLPPGLMGELIHRRGGMKVGVGVGKGEVSRAGFPNFLCERQALLSCLSIIPTSSPVLYSPALSASQSASQSACEVALNVSIWIVIEINDREIDRECKEGERESTGERWMS